MLIFFKTWSMVQLESSMTSSTVNKFRVSIDTIQGVSFGTTAQLENEAAKQGKLT